MNQNKRSTWWDSAANGLSFVKSDNPQLGPGPALVEKLCSNGSSLFAVESRFGLVRYGRVRVVNGQLFVNHFQTRKPAEEKNVHLKFISFKELMARFSDGVDFPKKSQIRPKGSVDLPRKVFLELTPVGSQRVRGDPFNVVIETDKDSPRGMNFRLLCSALKGPSYGGAFVYGKPNACYILDGPEPVVRRIRSEDPDEPLRENGVYGMEELDSWFWAQLEDDLSSYAPRFGSLVGGRQDLVSLGRVNGTVTESGFVI